jgi:hypothetical protein
MPSVVDKFERYKPLLVKGFLGIASPEHWNKIPVPSKKTTAKLKALRQRRRAFNIFPSVFAC